MEQLEIILFWLTVFIYVAAFFVDLYGFVAVKEKSVTFAIRLAWIGFIAHTAMGITRWIAGGHAPVADTYELNITGTWFALLVFLLLDRFGRVPRQISIFVLAVTFLILGHSYVVRTEAIPLGPAYKSLWLIVHVIFAWLSFGFYLISTGAAVFLLLKNKITSWKPELKIPDADALDITSYRFITMGFINHAIMLISGAIWAKKLWGHYWNWDALETWSLISFLFYAFYLHARSFLKWKMRRAAFLAIIGLFVMAISFWGVQWFSPSIHPGP
jgi:cytochrome c-type biogenesis protein CcsB